MSISIVGVAWYKKEDYETLKRLFTDGENLPETYDEWLKKAEGRLDEFRRNGQAFQKVYIDPDTFPAWCASRGIDIDAKARTRFSAEGVGPINQKE
jgi:hypothetical protein